jgi:hypothetical protein
VAAQSKAWTVFARSNAGTVGSNPTQGIDVFLHLFYVYFVLCVGRGLATGWSPILGALPSVHRIKKLKSGSTAPLGPGLWFFSFMIISQTVGLLGRVISSSQRLYLNTGRHKHRINTYIYQTSMPCVRFEPTIPASERANTVHALDRSATMTGLLEDFFLWCCSPHLGLGLPPWNSPFWEFTSPKFRGLLISFCLQFIACFPSAFLSPWFLPVTCIHRGSWLYQ